MLKLVLHAGSVADARSTPGSLGFGDFSEERLWSRVAPKLSKPKWTAILWAANLRSEVT